MKLWRLDASDNTDSDAGGWTRLFVWRGQAEDCQRQHEQTGAWLLDLYEEELDGEPPLSVLQRLVRNVWPVLPLEELLQLASAPAAAAKADLEQILAKRQKPEQLLA